MSIVDADRNFLLNELEYVTFINKLTNNRYVASTTLATLPPGLSQNYQTLQVGGEIEIAGAQPPFTQNQEALDKICEATGQAIYLAINGVPGNLFTPAPATNPPSTTSPSGGASGGASTLAAITMAPTVPPTPLVFRAHQNYPELSIHTSFITSVAVPFGTTVDTIPEATKDMMLKGFTQFVKDIVPELVEHENEKLHANDAATSLHSPPANGTASANPSAVQMTLTPSALGSGAPLTGAPSAGGTPASGAPITQAPTVPQARRLYLRGGGGAQRELQLAAPQTQPPTTIAPLPAAAAAAPLTVAPTSGAPLVGAATPDPSAAGSASSPPAAGQTSTPPSNEASTAAVVLVATAPPTFPEGDSTQPEGPPNSSLNEDSPRFVHMEASAQCPPAPPAGNASTGAPANTLCLQVWAVYEVVVAKGQRREQMYDYLQENTGVAIVTKKIQTSMDAAVPGSGIVVHGLGEPIDKFPPPPPTVPPTVPATEAPKEEGGSNAFLAGGISSIAAVAAIACCLGSFIAYRKGWCGGGGGDDDDTAGGGGEDSKAQDHSEADGSRFDDEDDDE